MTNTKHTIQTKELTQTQVVPISTQILDTKTLLLDFGKAAFGTLLVPAPMVANPERLVVHLGEKLTIDGRVDRNPPGAVRYCRIEQQPVNHQNSCRLIIPADKQNTGPAAIKMPSHIGEVFPFHYAEIENAVEFPHDVFFQISVHYPFDENVALKDV